jgi:hypothetical protein
MGVIRDFYRVRRRLNDRLAQALREGHLEQELEKIEKQALRWWDSTAPKKASRRAMH